MTKKKLSDIFREKVVSRKERNQDGEWVLIEKVFHEKRPVESLSSPLRVVHYFIDLFVIALIIILLDLFLGFNQPGALNFITVIAYFGYYIIFEFFSQRTVGKYLTGSQVVNEYGERPDFKTICLRTASRIIPLDPYSFFWTNDGRFWHDIWTKTFVVSNDELSLIKRIQSGEKPNKSDKGQWDEWHSWQ